MVVGKAHITYCCFFDHAENVDSPGPPVWSIVGCIIGNGSNAQASVAERPIALPPVRQRSAVMDHQPTNRAHIHLRPSMCPDCLHLQYRMSVTDENFPTL